MTLHHRVPQCSLGKTCPDRVCEEQSYFVCHSGHALVRSESLILTLASTRCTSHTNRTRGRMTTYPRHSTCFLWQRREYQHSVPLLAHDCSAHGGMMKLLLCRAATRVMLSEHGVLLTVPVGMRQRTARPPMFRVN